MRRFLILADGSFGPMTSKTANACIRYVPEEVVAVIDFANAGRTVEDILGFGGDIPVVESFSDGMRFEPDALLIGIAPVGGQFPSAWRAIVLAALRAGMDIWSGLHTMLGIDAEFAAAAKAKGCVIRDLRRAPTDLDCGNGRVREVEATIVLTVGTDCNIGKMTTQLQVQSAVRDLGHRVHFGATGQTGILIEGRGIAVDAVVADFIAGAAERLTIEAAQDADIVLVEGQGSLLQPSYSGVTLGLMHGALPHAMVLCAEPTRTVIQHSPWVAIPPLPEVIAQYEQIMRYLRPSTVIAIALNTFDLSEADAHHAIRTAAAQTGLPVTDPVRFPAQPIAEAISAFHRARISQLH